MDYAQTAPLGLYCWDAAAAQPCGYVVVRRFPSHVRPRCLRAVVVGGKVYMVGDGGKLYCVDPATNCRCTAGHLDRAAPGSRRPATTSPPTARASMCRVLGDKVACIDVSRRRRVPRLGAPQAAAGRSLERRQPLQRAGPGDGRVPRRERLGGLLRRRQPGLAHTDRLAVHAQLLRSRHGGRDRHPDAGGRRQRRGRVLGLGDARSMHRRRL